MSLRRTVASGDTLTITSGTTQTYDTVNVDGTLNTDGTLNLTDDTPPGPTTGVGRLSGTALSTRIPKFRASALGTGSLTSTATSSPARSAPAAGTGTVVGTATTSPVRQTTAAGVGRGTLSALPNPVASVGTIASWGVEPGEVLTITAGETRTQPDTANIEGTLNVDGTLNLDSVALPGAGRLTASADATVFVPAVRVERFTLEWPIEEFLLELDRLDED